MTSFKYRYQQYKKRRTLHVRNSFGLSQLYALELLREPKKMQSKIKSWLKKKLVTRNKYIYWIKCTCQMTYYCTILGTTNAGTDENSNC